MRLAEKKIRSMLLPSIKDSLFKLSKELEETGLATYASENNDTSLADTQNKAIVNSTEAMNFRNNFSVFRSLIRRIHSTSKLPDAGNSNSFDIINILNIFSKNNIYSPGWANNKEVASAFNTDEKVVQDAENAGYIQKTIETAKYNIASEILKLLFGYTKYQLSFKFKFNDYMSKDISIDLSANHPLYSNGYVLFEIKCDREKAYSPTREHVFQLYENLKSVDTKLKSKTSQIVLISYSSVQIEQFETVKYKFHQFAKQLKIPSSYLQRINFIPASLMEPISVETGISKLYEKISSRNINYDFVGAEAIKNNHEILPQYFETTTDEIIATIIPQNTEYWRFGFVLSNEREFNIDRESPDRHNNQETVDIHLCVGNLSQDKWQDGNQLTLTHYKAHVIDNSFGSFLEYNQEPVTMRIRFSKNKVGVTILLNKKSLGTTEFTCDKKYIHFMAWCDFHEYHLNVSFDVKPNTSDTIQSNLNL